MLHRLFLFLFFIHLSILVQSQVQDSLITIEFNEIPVSEALSRLNSNTSFRFAYNSGDLKTDTISISFLKKDLAFILSNILPQNYSYSVRNKLVIVYQKDLNKPSIESPTAVDFSIRGTVLDLQKKEPLPYAYLYIPSKNLFTESDKYGNFIFHQVPNDTALIKVEYIGYITKVFYLNPKMDKENIQIYLSNANVINEVNGSANVINTLKTKSVSNLGETDALALVKYVSGFNPAADGDDVYSFNGLKPDENSYQLDGVNVLSPSHFYGLFI